MLAGQLESGIAQSLKGPPPPPRTQSEASIPASPGFTCFLEALPEHPTDTHFSHFKANMVPKWIQNGIKMAPKSIPKTDPAQDPHNQLILLICLWMFLFVFVYTFN